MPINGAGSRFPRLSRVFGAVRKRHSGNLGLRRFIMCKKLIFLVSFVVVLALASSVPAKTYWEGAVSSDWYTAGNWDNIVPTSDEGTYVQSLTPITWPIIDGGTANTAQLKIGHGNLTIGELTVTGGATLNVGDGLHMGRKIYGGVQSVGKLYISGETTKILVPGLIECGRHGHGTIDMSGGYLHTDAELRLSYRDDSRSEVYIRGGIIKTEGNPGVTVTAGDDMPAPALIDISGDGKLILAGDQTALVAELRASGVLTGDGKGPRYIAAAYDPQEGTTTVAYDSDPSDGSEGAPPSYADVRYGRYERNVLDFWKAESSTQTPVLVYFHGGGFRGGDKKRYNPFFLQSCMASGISFAAANYRLSAQAEYPAQMHDSARAIQYLRSKAKQWNIDTNRIAAFGGSAGSGISLWLAFHDDLADPQSDDPMALQSSRLSCALAMQMQCTYDPREIKKIIPGNAYDVLPLKQLFGLPDDWDWDKDEISETLSARLKDASPITHLTKDDPPAFLYHRKAQERPGNIHHANFGRYLKRAMDKLGVECVHRMDSDYENTQAAFRDMMQFIKKQFGLR